MIVRQYIKEFEKLGFGMFVHYGLYSLVGTGEWAKLCNNIADEDYYPLVEQFNPKADWATELVKTAKNAGCQYITLTTRHHDGFSLYDTCGLNTYDAPHSKCGRDLVREFVDACNEEGIIPFFYHTLLDWWHVDFNADFPKYLEYLRKSVEILCKNYGKIGGIWFDGMWSKPEDDWEEDALYGLIRKYQPEAMIINNTGLNARASLGHIELYSVTLERGKPGPINMAGAPKYIASEMCQVFCDHWGYAEDDLNYKAPGQMIRELADCRRYRSNMLMNVGPMRDGSIRDIDKATLKLMGRWVAYFDEAIREPEPTDIVVEGKQDDFVLKHGKNYYLFCYNLPMIADANVAIFENTAYDSVFKLADKIQSVKWMDNGEEVAFKQDGEDVTITTVPFTYGRNLVVRVAKIVCE